MTVKQQIESRQKSLKQMGKAFKAVNDEWAAAVVGAVVIPGG